MKGKILVGLSVAVAVMVSGLPAPTGSSEPAGAAASGVNYTYDAAGRLKTVTDPAGAQATYNYDPVGNLLSITRGTTAAAAAAAPAVATASPKPAEPTVTAVEPVTASSGERVAISGSGFATEPLDNSVRVAKTAATVVTASPTRLEVVVPPGTRGGKVAVTTPGGRALSRQPLAVRGGADDEIPKAQKRPTRLPTAARGATALAGQVLKLDGSPLAGVTLSIGKASVVTNQAGQFLLKGVAPGRQELVINGASVAGPDRYGLYEAGVQLAAGKTTVLPWDISMPAQDMASAVTIASPTTQDVVVKNPQVPGLEVRVPAGTTITDRFGQPVTQLTLTPLPLDRTPVPLAPGMPIYFDLQPGGAKVSGAGLKVVYPNVTNHPAGTRLPFVTYDPTAPGEGWRAYGSGVVTPQGTITPDEHTAIYKTSGFSVVWNPFCEDTPSPFFVLATMLILCPPPGEESEDGDPVNLSTGLFVMEKTDLVLPDVVPVALTRTYRQSFNVLGAFGRGQFNDLDLFVAPDSAGNYGIGLPDGGKVAFVPGSDGVYRAPNGPTQFSGAVLTRLSTYDFTATLKDGTVLTFGQKTASLLGITDRFGNKVTLRRNGSGQLERVTSPNGRWLAFTWGTCIGSSLCITKATDNIGRSTSYRYDEFGRLTTVTDAAGKTTTYGWAPCDERCTQLLTITDPLGITWLTNRYDANGRVSLQTQADGTTYKFAYVLDANGKVTKTTVTDPRGIARAVTFNASGYTTTDTRAVGKAEAQKTTITRNSTTNLVTKTLDALSRSTTFTYDALGNVRTVTRMAATPSAVTTSFTYEPTFNRIATVTDPLNRVTRFTYDDAAHTITATNPLGKSSVTTLLEGQPVSITDALGNRTDLSYFNGDLVAVADPLGRVTTRYVDDGGRLRRATDPQGNYAQFTYDALNQVTSATDPLGGVTSSTYDANGNLLSLKDAKNQTTTYAYDNLDRPRERKDPLGRAQTFTYDAGGNLKTSTDRNGTVTLHDYDSLGRESLTTFGSTATGSESTIAYTYDAGNRLTKAVDSKAGTIDQAYDLLDRMTSQTTPQGSVAYTYDNVDRRATMTVAGQTRVDYGYDDGDRLTSITQGPSVASYAYDAIDRQTSLTLPNGLVQDYGYDAASQLESITYKSGTATIGNLTHTYDASGRRTSVGGSYARSGLPDALASATYNANNELKTFGTKTLTYDNEGQLKTDGTDTYTWNARGELASISGGTTASFTYDAFGRRMDKKLGAALPTAFLYDGPNAVQELSGTSPTANMLTGGVDETLTRTDPAGTRQFLTDALGSTVALTDDARALTTQYTYDPFGKTMSSGTASKNASQYTGRENDGTGLYYYRARYYSPTLQRFISQDPIGFGGGDTNLSAYVGNSPTNVTDPSGLVAPVVAACVGGAISDVAIGVGVDVLTGRKVTLKGILKDAAIGCLTGMAGLGLGKVFGKFKGLFGKGASKADDAAGAACKVNSFTPETRVLMGDGSHKPIAEVRVGDMVIAADPQTGERGARRVTDVIVGDGEKDLVDLEVHGHTITTTSRHPFWVVGAGWIDAENLKAGTVLRLADGRTIKIAAVRRRTAVQAVRNLTVSGIHTYHVLAGDQPILVHNCNLDDLTSLHGAKPDSVADAAKRQGWDGPHPSNDGNGEIWRHPTKRGEQIIINQGYPGAADPTHGGPYVKISRNGRVTRIPLEGNPGL